MRAICISQNLINLITFVCGVSPLSLRQAKAHQYQSYISSFFSPSMYPYPSKLSIILMNPHNNKIQFYSPFSMGHAVPIAKLAELIQSKFPNHQITLITFQITKQRLMKDFPMLEIIGIRPDFTIENERKVVTLPHYQMFPLQFNMFKEYFEEKKELPELMVCDWFAVQAARFAKENKVKLIFDFPNSYNVKNLVSFVSIDRCHLIQGHLVHQQQRNEPVLAPFDPIIESFRHWGRVMFHTFVGLDEACIKPSNHEFIGLLPNRKMQVVTQELRDWMDSWKTKGKEKFLYVSFGSQLTVSSVFSKKLAKVLGSLDFPTIWSLRTLERISLEDPMIYHKEWLPQQAILRLPQVRGYMSHCGWGSISEAITSKTPLICVPIFGDQPSNAKMAVAKHIGVQIYDTDNLTIPQELYLQLIDNTVIAGVNEVMTNDSYLKSIERLNRLSSLHSAEENIVRIFTETLQFGNEHLICQKYEDATRKTNVPLFNILAKEYLPLQQDTQ